MTLWFGIFATVGVTLLLCQMVLTLVGFGSDDFDSGSADGGHAGDASHGSEDGAAHDGHSHHGPNWFFGVVSFRTLTAAVAFFGLAGLGLNALGASRLTTLSGAILAGVGAMYLVHWLMQSMALLRADGTVRLERAVGAIGTVYIPVPGHHEGTGKISLNLDSQTVELSARTALDPLPTGTRVVVVSVIGGEMVEVAPAKSGLEAAQS